MSETLNGDMILSAMVFISVYLFSAALFEHKKVLEFLIVD
jgi:hypothetical protein